MLDFFLTKLPNRLNYALIRPLQREAFAYLLAQDIYINRCRRKDNNLNDIMTDTLFTNFMVKPGVLSYPASDTSSPI